jgi:hypothetical protein
MKAKDNLRVRARDLRQENWSVNDIAVEIGVARSTAWLWVRDLPLDRDSERAREKRARGKLLTDGRWAEHRVARDALYTAAVTAAAAEIGALTEREVTLLGAAIYWCEGSKTKPWRPFDTRMTFTNSDPGLIALFLAFLRATGVDDGRVRYRVAIHESADPAEATAWWAERCGLPLDRFHPPTVKRHAGVTRRHNVGRDYHGCLVVTVSYPRPVYWRIKGLMAGIVAAIGYRSGGDDGSRYA